MKKLLLILYSVLLFSCKANTDTELWHSERNNIVNVSAQLKEINIQDALFTYPIMYTLNSYLIIGDLGSQSNYIHIFNKNTFEYLCSTAPKGRGNGEVAALSAIATDQDSNTFYVKDGGKRNILKYDIDSVLANPIAYKPTEKAILSKEYYPQHFTYISDTLSYATIVLPAANSVHNEMLAKWNMQTGKITPFHYQHPDIQRKRIWMCISEENNIAIEVYQHHDLMTIYGLDGMLKRNIYGKQWDSKTSNEYLFYGTSPMVIKDKIVVNFSYGKKNTLDNNKATSLLLFDIEGNYIKTLELGNKIVKYCYDADNNRLVFSFDGIMQFAYLNLDSLICNSV